MRPETDIYFLRLACVVATRSTCLRRAVGCVLVDERRHVLATGYNGVEAGAPHCNEPGGIGTRVWDSDRADYVNTYPHACSGAMAASGSDLVGCAAVHAEQNTLVQCRDAAAIDAAYVTTSPCDACVKLLLATGCRRIIYATAYPDGGVERWLQAGRQVRRIAPVELFDHDHRHGSFAVRP